MAARARARVTRTKAPLELPRMSWGEVALVTLAILALIYVCWVARTVLIPIAIAFTLQGLFSPIVRSLARRGVPRSVGALGVLLFLTGALVAAVYFLAAPAAEWFAELPKTAGQLEERLEELRAPVDFVAETAAQVEDLAESTAKQNPSEAAPIVVVQQEDSLFDTWVGYTYQLGISAGLALALLFLLLSNDGAFLRNLQGSLGSLRERRVAAATVLGFQHGLSTYLLTVAAINTGLGLALGLALWAIGMPNPALWGVMAGLLNFVPYLGTTVGIAIVAFVSVVSFNTVGGMLLPPLTYFVLSGIEGTVISPLLVGNRLALSPVAVFLSVVVWGSLWGIVGAILAVPFLMAAMLLCKQVPQLQTLGRLLSRDPGPRPATNLLRAEVR